MNDGIRFTMGIKIAVMGGIVLLLLIPITNIRRLVNERHLYQKQAEHEIMKNWGGPQLLYGPQLNIAIKDTSQEENATSWIHIFADQLAIKAHLATELRQKGIYSMPVYQANIESTGAFVIADLKSLLNDQQEIIWDSAFVSVFLDDSRTIRKPIDLRWNGKDATFGPGRQNDHDQVSLESALVGLTEEDFPLRFSLKSELSASQQLQFSPTARSTRIEMTSDWLSPNFTGSPLPVQHQIDEQGFSAEWQMMNYGSRYPSHWIGECDFQSVIESEACGVNLYVASSIYQVSERSVKYAVLFILLTFFGFFLFEVVCQLKIHPVQYGMIGAAICLFYLLLLALGEQLPFALAYLISSLAEIALVAAYSATVLKTKKRAMIIAIILTAIYSYLWVVIVAVEYALLLGASALFLALALTMFITRNIDWYQFGQPKPPKFVS